MKPGRGIVRVSTAGLLAVMAFAGGCHKPRPFAYDFEGAGSLDELGWTCRTLYRLSPLHATSGSTSLEMTLHPAPQSIRDNYPGLSLTGFDPDWTRFRSLVFDAHLHGEQALVIGVRLDDRRDAAEGDWFRRAVALAPGDNHIVMPLAGLITDTGRNMRLQNVLGFTIYAANPSQRHLVYIDRVQLE